MTMLIVSVTIACVVVSTWAIYRLSRIAARVKVLEDKKQLDPSKRHFHFHGTFIDKQSVSRMMAHRGFIDGATNVHVHEQDNESPRDVADPPSAPLENSPSRDAVAPEEDG